MIIGELVPKNLALAIPLATGRIVIPFQIAFTTVFRPFVVVLNGTANAILRAIGIEPREEISAARTADELVSLVRRSAREGALDQDTATLLARTLAFSEHTASDVMTPRPKIAGVAQSDSALDHRARSGDRVLALSGVRRRRRRHRRDSCTSSRPSRCRAIGVPRCRCRRCSPRRCGCPRR